MGLLTNAAIIAILAIILAAGLFILFQKAHSTQLTAQGAEALVVNDIKTQNPTANVTLLPPGVTNSTLEKGSFTIPLSVVYNGSRPCPTFLIETFDYPATGLHPSNDTQLTSYSDGVCKVYIEGAIPSYPPVFIAAAYATGNSMVLSYVSKFGYANTSVSASYESNFSSNQSNIWLIRYSTLRTSNSLYVIVDPSGKVMQAYNSTA